MTDVCFICGYSNRKNLEEHHIIPRRFGGGDEDENLVTLCPTCHQAVEKIHDKRFYEGLGAYRTIAEFDDSNADPIIAHVRNVLEFITRTFRSSHDRIGSNTERLIAVILDEFGLEGQFCFSCYKLFNTKFESDDECPNCKGFVEVKT